MCYIFQGPADSGERQMTLQGLIAGTIMFRRLPSSHLPAIEVNSYKREREAL
jgi:hypothetical protein